MARIARLSLSLAALSCIGATTTLAADYPTKAIRLVVGFAPGGPTDIPARFIADKLSDRLGQRVVVEDKRSRPAWSRREVLSAA